MQVEYYAVVINTLLLIIAIPSLGYYIRKDIRTREDRNTERHEELKTAFKTMQDCMNYMKNELNKKVDTTECKEESKEKWDRINHHRHTETGEVVLPKWGA